MGPSTLLSQETRRGLVVEQQRRPYVILKWAATSDGFVARPDWSSKWISGEESRALVHQWRAEEDAILVGAKTALIDNPSLTARLSDGLLAKKQPLRVVLLPRGTLPSQALVLSENARTLLIVSSDNRASHSRLGPPVDVREIDWTKNIPAQVLRALFDLSIRSVIIEGGSYTLQQFIDSALWDEARVFISPKTFGAGVAAPRLSGAPISETVIGADVLRMYHSGEIAS